MSTDWRDPGVLSLLGSQVGLWRWELTSGRLEWSDHLLDMLGLDRADFIEDFGFFEGVLHPDDHELMRAEVEQHLATGAPFRLRCRIRHTDGTYLPTLAQGTSLPDESGEPSVLVGTVLDLSDEAEVSDRLAASEQSFRSLAENVPGAIYRYSLRPDGSDEIEYMSSGCEQIWELSAEEIQGDPSQLWAAVHADDLSSLQASVMQSASDLGPWHHQWRITTPSGVVKYLEGRGKPERRADGSVLWNSLILDVSSEQRIRDELVRKQQMLGQAQRLESLGRISGGIAHDFNNLLAIVMGNAELVEVARSEAERSSFVDAIVEACERGGDLTRRLLSFARQSTLSPEGVDLNETVAQVTSMVSRVLPSTISIETTTAADLWATTVDVALLESSILNLCINARDAMPDGGVLSITTANVELPEPGAPGGEATGRYVMVSVADTGVGIPSDVLAHVTEPFFTTKPPDLGSGLGLAMVEGFAQQSGGRLEIESDEGVGTEIRLLLPAGATPAVDGRDPTPADVDRGRVATRVLVVEDEPAVLALLERMLSDAGFETSTAPDGDTALERFGADAEAIDVLLTDIMMPGALQGRDLAKRLTALNPRLKVLFVSGYAHSGEEGDARLAPNERFLPKPVPRALLLRTLAGLAIIDDGGIAGS